MLPRRPRVYLIVIFIAVSICFSLRTLYKQCWSVKKSFPYFFNKSLDEKYIALDGDFCKFMLFCREKIPPDSEALFYNSWESCRKAYSIHVLIRFEYERYRARFYLYPIKVLTLPYNYNTIEKEELRYSDKEEILKRVSFVIANSADMEFPGFRVKYIYDAERRILVRE